MADNVSVFGAKKLALTPPQGLLGIVECEGMMNRVLTRAAVGMPVAVGMLVALAVAGALNRFLTVDEKKLRYQAPWMTGIIGIGPERFREINAMLPTVRSAL